MLISHQKQDFQCFSRQMTGQLTCHHATLYPKTISRQPWHSPVVSNSLINTLFLNSSMSTLNEHNGHLHSLTIATLCPNLNILFFSIFMLIPSSHQTYVVSMEHPNKHLFFYMLSLEATTHVFTGSILPISVSAATKK